MITILPPAKSLKEEKVSLSVEPTEPMFTNQVKELSQIMKKLSAKKIKELMKVSDNVASLNATRNKEFSQKHTESNSYPALFIYSGDTHRQLEKDSYTKKQLQFAQKNVLFISGLYGLLRAMDLVQPYRLEMKTKLDQNKHKSLPKFWEEDLAAYLNNQLKNHKDKVVLSVLSKEYAKAVNPELIEGRVITTTFQELRDGKYKSVGLLAKQARGMMGNYIIKNEIKTLDKVKKFNEAGYELDEKSSTEAELIFRRKQS